MKRFTLISTLIVLMSVNVNAQDFIWNKSFYNGLKAWNFQVMKHAENGDHLKAIAEPYAKESDKDHPHSIKVRIIKADRQDDYHTINLKQKLNGIKKSKKYRVSFWMRSNIGREVISGEKTPY